MEHYVVSTASLDHFLVAEVGRIAKQLHWSAYYSLVQNSTFWAPRTVGENCVELEDRRHLNQSWPVHDLRTCFGDNYGNCWLPVCICCAIAMFSAILLTYWIFEGRYCRSSESILPPDIQFWLCVFLDVNFILTLTFLCRSCRHT